MIKEIYLFTNRNIIAFDEKGEQVIDIQSAIGWNVDWYHHAKEEEALLKVIEDNPIIFLARWHEWKKEINLDEFCSLLGHGEWYWDYKNLLKDKKENAGNSL